MAVQRPVMKKVAVVAAAFCLAGRALLDGAAPQLFVNTSAGHATRGGQKNAACLVLAMGRSARDTRSRVAARAVGLIYSTQTGNTEEIADYLSEATGLETTAVDDLYASDLESYDGLIVGCPTWNTGADEYRSGTAWDDLLDDIKGLSLAGKPVAVFGCGDSQAYGDNFCDGIEELHDTFAAAGAKLIGYVPESGYTYAESKSVRNGKFLGLPLDQDNERDMSEERVASWVSQLKGEGMPL